jgi:hypothetical protein
VLAADASPECLTLAEVALGPDGEMDHRAMRTRWVRQMLRTAVGPSPGPEHFRANSLGPNLVLDARPLGSRAVVVAMPSPIERRHGELDAGLLRREAVTNGRS